MFPRIKLIKMDKAAHLPQIEDPSTFQNIIVDLLNKKA